MLLSSSRWAVCIRCIMNGRLRLSPLDCSLFCFAVRLFAILSYKRENVLVRLLNAVLQRKRQFVEDKAHSNDRCRQNFILSRFYVIIKLFPAHTILGCRKCNFIDNCVRIVYNWKRNEEATGHSLFVSVLKWRMPTSFRFFISRIIFLLFLRSFWFLLLFFASFSIFTFIFWWFLMIFRASMIIEAIRVFIYKHLRAPIARIFPQGEVLQSRCSRCVTAIGIWTKTQFINASEKSDLNYIIFILFVR